MECGDLYETGTEPEFFVQKIAKAEPVNDGMVRVYLSTMRQNHLRLEYTVLVTITDLAEMGRECLRIAAEGHNLLLWEEIDTMQ